MQEKTIYVVLDIFWKKLTRNSGMQKIVSDKCAAPILVKIIFFFSAIFRFKDPMRS